MEVTVVVIVLIVGLFLWARSKENQRVERLDLRYFEHEDDEGDTNTTRFRLDFQAMVMRIQADSIDNQNQPADVYNVRRLGSSRWQLKPTQASYDRRKAVLLRLVKEEKDRYNTKLSENEALLAKEPNDDDSNDFRMSINDFRKAQGKPTIQEEMQTDREFHDEEMKELQESLEKLGEWQPLEREFVGALETQYQRYLLHGHG